LWDCDDREPYHSNLGFDDEFEENGETYQFTTNRRRNSKFVPILRDVELFYEGEVPGQP
jgi:hypothetical protein